jgi:hypothetical protein
MASSSRGRPETAIGAFVLGDVNALTEREVQGEVMRVSPTKRRASAIGDHETALKLPAWKLLKVDTGALAIQADRVSYFRYRRVPD